MRHRSLLSVKAKLAKPIHAIGRSVNKKRTRLRRPLAGYLTDPGILYRLYGPKAVKNLIFCFCLKFFPHFATIQRVI